MNQDLLVVFDRQVNVLQEDGRFVLGVLVQSDLTDPEHIGSGQELGDHGDDFARERHILRLFGIDAQPCVVLDSVLGGPLGFELRQLTKVVSEAFDAAAIKASPESRFAHGDATHAG